MFLKNYEKRDVHDKYGYTQKGVFTSESIKKGEIIWKYEEFEENIKFAKTAEESGCSEGRKRPKNTTPINPNRAKNRSSPLRL